MTRFASCLHGARRFAAVIDGDSVRPLAGITQLGSETPSTVLADPVLADERVALDDVTLLPVIPEPQKIICVGANYEAHARETGRPTFSYPKLFTKFTDTLIAAEDPIVLPPESDEGDYEAELAVVIGRPARRLAVSEALSAVAGYTVANDVSIRDFQMRTDQVMPGKVWPRTTPLGPFLVTPDEVGDVTNLEIDLWLNEQRLQHANTGELTRSVSELIAIISELTPLSPGDVILTGTPQGVGFTRKPPIFLKPGDEVTVAISGIGRLVNPVAREVL